MKETSSPEYPPHYLESNWKAQWSLPDRIVYLNHGSFGPSPNTVRRSHENWSQQLEQQPCDFLLRRLPAHLDHALSRLADFLETSPDNLTFSDNATTAMNAVAQSTPLQPGDEVLLTDHEYGAVQRIWEHTCKRAGAKLTVATLPYPMTSVNKVVRCISESITERTRMLVISHITSPTAVILPVKPIVELARKRHVSVCIDGPHAPGMIPLQLDSLNCDYYTASCHKWLSAPFGSGFLYVHPRVQKTVQPAIISWGRPTENEQPKWQDEFQWGGTKDFSSWLSIPSAIDFLKSSDLMQFREYTHDMARYFRTHLEDYFDSTSFIPDSNEWYGSMVAMPLPSGPCKHLQKTLWDKYQTEIPVIEWKNHALIRISCHLYNDYQDVDHLLNALSELFPR